MNNLTKKQKRHLRKLTDLAYERDLSRCLDVIADRFDAWKRKEISVWDLNEDIHKYHNEIARDLYKAYSMNDLIFSVAFGVAQEVISIDDVENFCRDRVSSLSEAISAD